MDEQSYINGSRAAYTAMLQECLKQLNYDLATVKNPTWILEREGAIAQLRELCERFGDNDWNDNLNLADVIEKHLGRHLWGGAEDEFFGETEE